MDFKKHHKILPGMKPRPVTMLIDKRNVNEVFQSESSATFVFIKNCENYGLKIDGKLVKIMCENCKSIKIEVEKSLVSGTLELLRSQNTSVRILKDCEIPIIQIDDCKDVELEICQESQLKSIYFQRTEGIKVYIGSRENQELSQQHARELVVDTSLEAELQNVDEILQWVAHWNKSMSAFVTERVCRSGIFPKGEQMEAADKKENTVQKEDCSDLENKPISKNW